MAWKWYEAELVKMEEVNKTVRRFWVKPKEKVEFEPGQFVTMDLPISEKRLKRWRSYSIASLPGDDLLEFIIVNLEGGLGTSYLFQEFKIGDQLKFKGPSGTFVSPKSPDFDIVMICTGTGVAPFRPMLYNLLVDQKIERNIHLIFGTRHLEGVLYQKEFEKLASEYKNFSYDICLSREDIEGTHKGYVHDVYMGKYHEKREDLKFYLCGWSVMIDEAVLNLFKTLGYDRSQIIYELYG